MSRRKSSLANNVVDGCNLQFMTPPEQWVLNIFRLVLVDSKWLKDVTWKFWAWNWIHFRPKLVMGAWTQFYSLSPANYGSGSRFGSRVWSMVWKIGTTGSVVELVWHDHNVGFQGFIMWLGLRTGYTKRRGILTRKFSLRSNMRESSSIPSPKVGPPELHRTHHDNRHLSKWTVERGEKPSILTDLFLIYV